MKRCVCLLLSAVLLAGCSPRRESSARRQPTTAGRPTSARRLPAPQRAGALQPERLTSHPPGSLKPYRVSPDLREVSNLAAFQKALPLTDEQRSRLARNLFVLRRTDEKQLFHIYENNEYLRVPSFVTTDVALHLYHCFFDYALRTIEKERLLPILERLTQNGLALSRDELKRARTGPARQALVRNAAYFGVAARLLGLRDPVPGAAEPLVRAEIASIGKHAGYGKSALLPYMVDYSLFIPRGHYTRTPALKRYFMAMSWYGVVPFATRRADGTPTPDAVRQGLLLAWTLEQASLLNEWGRIYSATTFFAGKSDDHIPMQWLALAERIFGRAMRPDDVASDTRLRHFAEEVERLPQARIRAQMAAASDHPSPRHQLRLMGQRYLPDSEILQRLCHPTERPIPTGLDVMAVLGSERAVAFLDAHKALYNPRGWRGYGPERDRLTREFRSLPVRQWTENLYWSWLSALRPLLDRVPEGYPSFMASEAWQGKSLQTALASWAELRHDTILYGKQSAAEMGDGEDQPTPPGYVEPNLPLYERLLGLTASLEELLRRYNLLPVELKRAMNEFADLLRFLKRCSEKELRGELLSAQENTRIRFIGAEIEYLTRSTIEGQPNYWELVDRGDRDMAVVADVHTAPPVVLQVGVGRAAELLAIVPVGRRLILARGAAMTYYEFTHPMADRLTDEKWRDLLDTEDAPAPPVWTKGFLLQPQPSRPEPQPAEETEPSA